MSSLHLWFKCVGLASGWTEDRKRFLHVIYPETVEVKFGYVVWKFPSAITGTLSRCSPFQITDRNQNRAVPYEWIVWHPKNVTIEMTDIFCPFGCVVDYILKDFKKIWEVNSHWQKRKTWFFLQSITSILFQWNLVNVISTLTSMTDHAIMSM